METVGIMRMEVDGAEKLRECGGMLVLANHPTLIDVVALTL
jgi:1-acyl-sn-glycerol-3-phosphate acyltransferase